MYYIVYILDVILYYNIHIIMFGGFPEWVPLEIIAGWFMEVANPEKNRIWGGTPISGNLHLTGLMLVAGRICCFFPLEPT